MIVELTASRVLAPYFGNTLYTWTALIGVILLALSVGYYAGGAIADRYCRVTVLLHLVTAAALFVLLVPVLVGWVLPTLAPESHAVDLVWGPLSAALLLFALPGCLLGTVTPFAIKLLSLRTQNERVGTWAGTVAMLSTVGSVLGTFVAGFVLIPSLGVKAIFLVVGVSLAVAAALGYSGLLAMRSLPRAALILMVSVVFSMAAQVSTPPPADNVVFQTDSYYHRISIMRMNAPDGRGVTFLLTDGAPQGAQADWGERLVYAYNRYVRLEQLFCPRIERAAFLGGGAYSMPQKLSDDHPAALIDVVEIDPKLEELGRRWFRLDDYQGRIRPVTGDARQFLAAGGHEYDLIFGDVFRGRQTIPPHLATREFFELVKRRLDDDGVYMMNVTGALEGPRSRLFSCMAATLSEVFPELYVFAPHAPLPRSQLQNLVLVAPKRPRGWKQKDLVSRAAGDPRLEKMTANLVDPTEIDLSTATVLTDDFNPVEYLAARQMRP
ncbi:MAG: fused MFS/spermidine synthase [Pirellulales bacterium]|nr:fused MFS/spermidine synthase [Pirellulales bacterium]